MEGALASFVRRRPHAVPPTKGPVISCLTRCTVPAPTPSSRAILRHAKEWAPGGIHNTVARAKTPIRGAPAPATYRTKRAIRFCKNPGKTLRSECRKLASMLAHVKGFRCANIAPERGLSMSGRASRVRQHEVEKIVRGAMKAGAKRVDIHGDARAPRFVRMTTRNLLRPTRKSVFDAGHAKTTTAQATAGNDPPRQNGLVCPR